MDQQRASNLVFTALVTKSSPGVKNSLVPLFENRGAQYDGWGLGLPTWAVSVILKILLMVRDVGPVDIAQALSRGGFDNKSHFHIIFANFFVKHKVNGAPVATT